MQRGARQVAILLLGVLEDLDHPRAVVEEAVEDRVEPGHVDRRPRLGARPRNARLVGYREDVLRLAVHADHLHRAVGLAQRTRAAAGVPVRHVDDHPEEAAAALGELLALFGILDGDLLRRQVLDRLPHGLEHAEHLRHHRDLRALLLEAPAQHAVERTDERDEGDPAEARDGQLPLRRPDDDGRRRQDVDEPQRDEDLPGEAHELIDLQARHREPDPHQREHQDVGLDHEPHDGHQRDALDDDEVGERSLPPPEEQRGDDHRHDREAGVLVQVEHAEAHRRILGAVAAHELGLSFGKVEGPAVHLGDRRDVEDQEGERSVEDQPVVVTLPGDHLVEAPRADDHGHHEQREDHGDLIAHHLARRRAAPRPGSTCCATPSRPSGSTAR